VSGHAKPETNLPKSIGSDPAVGNTPNELTTRVSEMAYVTLAPLAGPIQYHRVPSCCDATALAVPTGVFAGRGRGVEGSCGFRLCCSTGRHSSPAVRIHLMVEISTQRKYRAVGRVVGKRAQQNRWLRAGSQGGSSLFRSLGRVLGVLWHQLTGVFFLAFALIGAIACYREYRVYAEGKVGAGKVALVGAFAVVFGYFAVSAFVRAGRRSSMRSNRDGTTKDGSRA